MAELYSAQFPMSRELESYPSFAAKGHDFRVIWRRWRLQKEGRWNRLGPTGPRDRAPQRATFLHMLFKGILCSI